MTSLKSWRFTSRLKWLLLILGVTKLQVLITNLVNEIRIGILFLVFGSSPAARWALWLRIAHRLSLVQRYDVCLSIHSMYNWPLYLTHVDSVSLTHCHLPVFCIYTRWIPFYRGIFLRALPMSVRSWSCIFWGIIAQSKFRMKRFVHNLSICINSRCTCLSSNYFFFKTWALFLIEDCRLGAIKTNLTIKLKFQCFFKSLSTRIFSGT